MSDPVDQASAAVPLWLGPHRVAQLADQRRERPLPEGMWGVWCIHEKRWVHGRGAGSERDAWLGLLDVVSPHPWELRIARADKEGQPLLGREGTPRCPPCDTCEGSGECPRCAGTGDCPDCGGSGQEDP